MTNSALLIDKIEAMEMLAKARRENFIDTYHPNKKQIEFHRQGAYYSERCLMAGNQLGKSLAGAAEFGGYHATGLYPDWWEGIRFDKPNTGWICGVTGEVVRDSVQLLVCGSVEKNELGTGTIPRTKIEGVTRAMGVANLLDSVRVKHVSGGTSLIRFKAYASGREKFQASTIDWIWDDEEPPIEIYSEGLTRTNHGQYGHCAALTYTPIMGMSDVTHMFLTTPSRNQIVVNMTLDDVDHYTEEAKEEIRESYLPHEREAREKGIPTIGSGRVFPVLEETIAEDTIRVPVHWAQLNGLDFGWDHPQACVNLAWDRDSDVIHITKTFRQRECTPVLAAFTIKKWADWIPCAWPHDGYQHDKGSGKQLAEQYREAGLEMLSEHATHDEGGYGIEAGISEMLERMQTGRLKVDRNLTEWWEEFRLYHRDKGIIIKERDDLMAATRYAIMMLREARTKPRHWEEDWQETERTEDSALGWS